MPVSKDIFLELTSLYYGYTHADDESKYLANQRKKIKVISDSLWEQTLENIFHEKPRNNTAALRMINRKREALTNNDDINVVNAVYGLLKDYDAVTDKMYIDIAKKLSPFFVGPLKRLCLALSAHGDHAGSHRANKLIELLGEV